MRHDLRVWESAAAAGSPGCGTPSGSLLLGDALLDDWRARARGGAPPGCGPTTTCTPRRRAPSRSTRRRRNRFGDPLPRIEHQVDEATLARAAATKRHVREVFARMARHDGGTDPERERG